jgi:hypothetical protein
MVQCDWIDWIVIFFFFLLLPNAALCNSAKALQDRLRVTQCETHHSQRQPAMDARSRHAGRCREQYMSSRGRGKSSDPESYPLFLFFFFFFFRFAGNAVGFPRSSSRFDAECTYVAVTYVCTRRRAMTVVVVRTTRNLRTRDLHARLRVAGGVVLTWRWGLGCVFLERELSVLDREREGFVCLLMTDGPLECSSW